MAYLQARISALEAHRRALLARRGIQSTDADQVARTKGQLRALIIRKLQPGIFITETTDWTFFSS